jgi:hypothetical protein
MPRVSLPSSVVVLIAFPISYLGNISGEQLWSKTHNDNADDEDYEDDDIAYDAEVESMLWYDANIAMPEPLEWDTKHSTIAKVIITAPPPTSSPNHVHRLTVAHTTNAIAPMGQVLLNISEGQPRVAMADVG